MKIGRNLAAKVMLLAMCVFSASVPLKADAGAAADSLNTATESWKIGEASEMMSKAELVKASAKTKPEAPELTEIFAISYNSVEINWKKVKKVSGYAVYRKEGKNWICIAYVDSSATRYRDKGLSCGSTYYYKVRAYVTSGSDRIFSEFQKDGLKAQTELETPELVSAKFTDQDTIQVTWKSVKGADGYYVFRKKGSK